MKIDFPISSRLGYNAEKSLVERRIFHFSRFFAA